MMSEQRLYNGNSANRESKHRRGGCRPGIAVLQSRVRWFGLGVWGLSLGLRVQGAQYNLGPARAELRNLGFWIIG